MWYVDDKAPAWIDTYPRLNSEQITSSEIELMVKTDKMSDVISVCLPDGAEARAAASKDGRNAEGVRVGNGLSENKHNKQNTDYPVSITNLSPATKYNIYIAAEDATASNIQRNLF